MEIQYCDRCLRKMHKKVAQEDLNLSWEQSQIFFEVLCKFYLQARNEGINWIVVSGCCSLSPSEQKEREDLLFFLESSRFIVTLETKIDDREMVFARPLGLCKKQENLFDFCVAKH